jgi:hypothetical protein
MSEMPREQLNEMAITSDLLKRMLETWNLRKPSILGSDPEIGCSFHNVPAKTDLMDTFRGGHPEKIAI